LGLPVFLPPDGRHSSTPFGSLPSSTLWTVRTVGVVSFLRHLKGILSRSFSHYSCLIWQELFVLCWYASVKKQWNCCVPLLFQDEDQYF
jgi:hypothetical protein